jgi:hypothetical protein
VDFFLATSFLVAALFFTGLLAAFRGAFLTALFAFFLTVFLTTFRVVLLATFRVALVDLLPPFAFFFAFAMPDLRRAGARMREL